MDTITGYLSAHPAMFKFIVIFALIIISFFIFKQFLKLSLFLLLVVLVIAGYYYFQDPNKMPERVKKSIDTMKSGTTEVVNKSKSFYKDSKELINKTKELPGDVNKLLKGSEDEKEK
jgi:glucan phosphoethanolaminetransferase (alkaline phosphatase superfamily)